MFSTPLHKTFAQSRNCVKVENLRKNKKHSSTSLLYKIEIALHFVRLKDLGDAVAEARSVYARDIELILCGNKACLDLLLHLRLRLVKAALPYVSKRGGFKVL